MCKQTTLGVQESVKKFCGKCEVFSVNGIPTERIRHTGVFANEAEVMFILLLHAGGDSHGAWSFAQDRAKEHGLTECPYGMTHTGEFVRAEPLVDEARAE
jgi:hypothetical protein